MWFLNNLARFHKEREAVDKLISAEEWLTLAEWEIKDTKLCFNANIEIFGRHFLVVMIYPTNYPASPPTVRPREENQRWSTHQYLSGELCLEWGPDNWREEITGADVLISAYKLLEIENPMEEDSSRIVAPSRHSLTLGQELRFNSWRFITDDLLISYTQSLPEKVSGTIQFRLVITRKNVVAFLESFSPFNDENWCHPKLPPELKKTTSKIEGYFFKTNLEADALNLEGLDSPFDALEAHGYDVSQLKSTSTCLALFIDNSGGLHLFFISDEKKWHRFAEVNIDNLQENSRLQNEFIHLNTKKVGIVGLGSAGSKIAISLARSGVRNFLFVDHDVFLPENICRHELNWEDVGQHKVHGIEHQVKLIAQDTNVKCYCFKLSGQESTGIVDSILSQLGECDLIVDATADSLTFNQLATVASQQQKPMVWFEIYAGGIGGMLARFRPNVDPDPLTTRASLHEYLEKLNLPKIKEITDYTAVNDDGNTIIASDADVAVIAANTTRMALDILTERYPSDYPYSLYLIGLSKSWIFDQPFDTQPINLPGLKSTITESNLSDVEVTENINFLEELISKQSYENSSNG